MDTADTTAASVSTDPQIDAATSQLADIVPKHTLYINNLNDTIKIDTMKQALHAGFSQFGPIVDIVMRKSYRLRGQAFIIFRDIESAAKALRTMQGFIFYDKPMRLYYAKTEADTITKQRGTFVQRPAKPKLEIKKKEKSHTNGNTDHARMLQDEADQEMNKILFITNLPEETNEAMFTLLFNQFPGFKEVRLIPGRSDIAFVEFENEYLAATAKEALNGFSLSPTHKMRITFAKK